MTDTDQFDHAVQESRRALLYWDGSGDPPAGPDDANEAVRAARLLALGRTKRLEPADVIVGLYDVSQRVRLCTLRLTAAHSSTHNSAVRDALRELVTGPDHLVAEAAAAALGETGNEDDSGVELAVETATVGVLSKAVLEHPDKLVREAATAALGSLGHPDGLPAVLVANDDVATVRRRAVLALAAFDGPEVEQRLNAALTDRDWQVRQGAEDLLDAAPSPTPHPTETSADQPD